jgi:hypothetical protein
LKIFKRDFEKDFAKKSYKNKGSDFFENYCIKISKIKKIILITKIRYAHFWLAAKVTSYLKN